MENRLVYDHVAGESHDQWMEKQQCERDKKCKWETEGKDEFNGHITTGCSNDYYLYEDTPTINGFKFCVYCGKPIDDKTLA